MQKLGVFWKIQDICYQMGTEIFKIEEEMTKKMKPKVTNPPSKMGRILFSQYTLFRALWSLNLAKGTKLPLFYLFYLFSLPTCGTSLAFIASHGNAKDHQRSA